MKQKQKFVLGLKKDGTFLNITFLNHLRFADDIVIVSSEESELQTVLHELKIASEARGLKANLGKTKPGDVYWLKK